MSVHRNSSKLFLFPPNLSQSDTLIRIRKGFEELPGVLEFVSMRSPQSLGRCECLHLAKNMEGTINGAIARVSAEKILVTDRALPRALAAIVGGYAAAFKVSSFAHAAAIRQAPRALARIHVEWLKLAVRLKVIRRALTARNCDQCAHSCLCSRYGHCALCAQCGSCSELISLRASLRTTTHGLAREHQATCARLAAILVAR
jgi:hypothetical protein